MPGTGNSANVAELRARAARLERELRETRRLIGEADGDVEAGSAELARTRGYAFDAASLPADQVVSGCVESIHRYGFTVIEHAIPADQVAAVRDEVIAAERIIGRNIAAIRDLQSGKTGTEIPPVELRPVRRAGHPPKPPNDIVWLSLYARHLANPVVTELARRVLDDHLRIAQLHLRIIEADRPDGTLGGFGPVQSRGREFRGWHTDWPHDLSAYGAGNPLHNVGCVRQPFPDLTMCLVMIWYLTDVDAESGGTWVVPGSHRDTRNPRGPGDGISIVAPIPGELQVSAPAGSVYIQDSRSWHASAMHNTRHARVAVVNRWAPWWLAVDGARRHLQRQHGLPPAVARRVPRPAGRPAAADASPVPRRARRPAAAGAGPRRRGRALRPRGAQPSQRGSRLSGAGQRPHTCPDRSRRLILSCIPPYFTSWRNNLHPCH